MLDAVNIYMNIGQWSADYAVPKELYLLPLSTLSPSVARIALDLNAYVADAVSTRLQDYENLKMRLGDAKLVSIYAKFVHYQSQLNDFDSALTVRGFPCFYGKFISK